MFHRDTPQAGQVEVRPVPTLARTAFPLILSMGASALYGLVDGIFVAGAGEGALAAVTFASPVQTTMIALATGFAVGVNANLARSFGEKDASRVAACFQWALVMAAAFSMLAVFFSVFGSSPYAAAVAGEGAAAPLCASYLSIICGVSFGYFFEVALESVLLSSGRPTLSMVSQVTGAVLNIALDFLLVPGNFGLPTLGVVGAALATVIAQGIACILALVLNLRVNGALVRGMFSRRPKGDVLVSIARISIPSVGIQLVSSIAAFGMNAILAQASPDYVASYGAFWRVQGFFFMPIYGLSNALIVVASRFLGEGNQRAAAEAFRASMIGAVGFTGAAAIFIGCDAGFLVSAFSLGYIGQMAAAAFCVLALSMPFMAANVIANAVFQYGDRASLSLGLTVFRYTCMLAFAFAFATLFGMDVVWWALPAAEASGSILAAILVVRMRSTDEVACL